MRGSRTGRLLVVLCALAVVAAACSNESSGSKGTSTDSSGGASSAVDQPGVTKDTIRVGGVASISNPLNAPYGNIFKGAKAYFAMVNSEGGIYGRKIQLVSERDDQISNNLREVQGLLTEDNVFAAVGMAT